jgi:hypothetical protein
MNELIAKAIEKAAAKPAKKLSLKEGVYDVDETLTIRVQGQIKKFKDEEYTPTADIPLKAALALVLEKSGVTRDAASKLLVEAMTEALEAGEKAQAAVQARLNDIDAAMERVQSAAAKLPDKTRKGKTTCKVTLEVLEGAVA